MFADAAWSLFEEHVFSIPSDERSFNPYRDVHSDLDRPEADAIRRANLRRYLDAYETAPPVLLLAEAPGPWGCRFSGVPITSEAQLVDSDFPLSGTPSSRDDEPKTEYSAGIYWRAMAPYFPHFFTWNSVPYHPHKPGEPLTIRTPGRREVRSCAAAVKGLVALLQPRLVLAVGRKAEFSLQELGVACTYVRHPSQGGATKFAVGVEAAFERLDLG